MIGDREFVINALDSAQAAKLRISRFEREGITIDSIAVEIGKRFNVAADQLKKRHRNNAVSDARKAFAFAADNEYHAPHRIIAADLTVGSTAISEMARKEKLIMVERGIGN